MTSPVTLPMTSLDDNTGCPLSDCYFNLLAAKFGGFDNKMISGGSLPPQVILKLYIPFPNADNGNDFGNTTIYSSLFV